MYIAAAEVYLTGPVAAPAPFAFRLLRSDISSENTLRTTPFHSITGAHIHLRIIRLPLAKGVRQTTTNHVRNTQTNSGSPYQPSCAKLATKALLSPSSKNQVRRAPSRCQARAVGLEAVDVEVGAEEEDWREEHGQRLEGTHVLGDNESREECGGQWVLCMVCQSSGAVFGGWSWNIPPQALAYCRTPCLACSSGVFPGIGIVGCGFGVIECDWRDDAMQWCQRQLISCLSNTNLSRVLKVTSFAISIPPCLRH